MSKFPLSTFLLLTQIAQIKSNFKITFNFQKLLCRLDRLPFNEGAEFSLLWIGSTVFFRPGNDAQLLARSIFNENKLTI